MTGIERHVLDESHLETDLPCEGDELGDFAFVAASHDDGVHLDRAKVLGNGVADGLNNARGPGPFAVARHGVKDLGRDSVERERQTLQPGVLPFPHQLRRAEGPVRGHAKIIDAESGDATDDLRELGVDGWLAPSEANMTNAEVHARADEAGHVIDGEKSPGIGEAHIRVHAVDAAEVATVCDGEPQVTDRAAMGIDQVAGKRGGALAGRCGNA